MGLIIPKEEKCLLQSVNMSFCYLYRSVFLGTKGSTADGLQKAEARLPARAAAARLQPSPGGEPGGAEAAQRSHRPVLQVPVVSGECQWSHRPAFQAPVVADEQHRSLSISTVI